MLKRTKGLQRTNSKLKQNKPLARKGTTLARGKALKSKPVPQDVKDMRKAEGEAMMELFTRHWDNSPHRCESCGCILKGENNTMYHHHLLPKGVAKYKHLRYEIDNLMLLCVQCHSAHENGYSSPAIQTETEWAKVRFNIK